MSDDGLTPEMIRYAYERGYFPMTTDGGKIEWFSVRRRCLFPLTGVHVSRSLAKTIRRRVFEVRFDTAFEDVMYGCLRPGDNWISAPFFTAYGQAFREGWAHCAECWSDGELVGGVYGVVVGGCFCAESMFHRRTDASKVALWALVEKCRELGFVLFDAQIMNPHLASLGAYEVSAREYASLLQSALQVSTAWSPR